MTWTVAVAGQGGTGKTTVASLLVRGLMKSGKVPVLAVDADPDANFSTGLGIEVNKSIGQVQQEWLAAKMQIPPGMSKQQYLLLQLNQAVEERKNFDLVTMGRPQGPGCYCSAHAVLRDFLGEMQGNYKSMVVDNEAGMEHLSRRTVEGIDALVMVSDPSHVGIRTAGRLMELAKELNLGIPRMGLVINRVMNGVPRQIEDAAQKLNIELLGTVPMDDDLTDFSMDEKSLLDLPDSCSAAGAVSEIIDKLVSD